MCLHSYIYRYTVQNRYTYIPLERILYCTRESVQDVKEMKPQTIINFSHPLSEAALEQLDNPDIENVTVQLDIGAPIAPQIRTIIDAVSTSLDGTVPSLAIVLPGMSEATAYILSELHGRMGSFPAIVPLRRDADLGIFVVADESTQSLEAVRQDARKCRA